LEILFECYGRLHRLHYSKLRAHVAFVHFKKKSDATKALRELDFYELKSSQIRVKWIDEEYEEEDNISGRLIRKTLLKSH
jgi:RNA recognition motif-containing protein